MWKHWRYKEPRISLDRTQQCLQHVHMWHAYFRNPIVAFLQKKRNETMNTNTTLIPPVYKTAFFRKLVAFLKTKMNYKNTKKGSLVPLSLWFPCGNKLLTTWEKNKNFFAFAKAFEIETINLTNIPQIACNTPYIFLKLQESMTETEEDIEC